MKRNEKSNTHPTRLRRFEPKFSDNNHLPSYFITFCVQDRQKVLANKFYFEGLIAFLLDSPGSYGWFPGMFVVMPDHVHLIVTHSPEAVSMGGWMKALKAITKRSIKAEPDRDWRWQIGFYDHLFRSEKSRTEKWYYVLHNPVRAGLVAKPEDWPYTGVVEYSEQEGVLFKPFGADSKRDR